MTAEERFWSKVDKSAGPEGCWPWTGHRNPQGYGSFALRPGRHGYHKPTGAHRVASILTEGPLPDGHRVVVRHTCDNPPCVNPKHLVRGAPVENLRDQMLRGRRSRSIVASRKLSEGDVREIRARPSVSGAALARQYGVSSSLISNIRRGKAWREVA